jgi:hypothetical protein
MCDHILLITDDGFDNIVHRRVSTYREAQSLMNNEIYWWYDYCLLCGEKLNHNAIREAILTPARSR